MSICAVRISTILVHTPRTLQIPRLIAPSFPQPLRKPDHPSLPIRELGLLPELIVVALGHLLFQEPLLGGVPHFHQSEVAAIFGIFEDVEEDAFGFFGAGVPDGVVAFFPFFDQLGLDVEVDEEGELGLWLGLGHGDWMLGPLCWIWNDIVVPLS